MAELLWSLGLLWQFPVSCWWDPHPCRRATGAVAPGFTKAPAISLLKPSSPRWGGSLRIQAGLGPRGSGGLGRAPGLSHSPTLPAAATAPSPPHHAGPARPCHRAVTTCTLAPCTGACGGPSSGERTHLPYHGLQPCRAPPAVQGPLSPCLLFLPSRHSRESLLSFRGRPRFRFPCLRSPFL